MGDSDSVEVGEQVVAGVLVARERANDGGVFERCRIVTEAGRKRGCGVTEQADDELVANVEARQRGAQLAQSIHCLRGGETVGSTSLSQHGLTVHIDSVLTQGVAELGG